MAEKCLEKCQEDYQIRDGVLLRYTGREEEITVPAGIHTVGDGAFKGCVSLKKVVLPSGLARIMGDAFKGCRRLEEVVFPDGVSYIGRYAFHRCHALRRVILPRSVEELGECAFLYCDSMREAWLPGVKRMGMAALANGISLEKLAISRDLDEHCICDVFTGCGRVREITCVEPDDAGSGVNCETYCIPNVVEVVAGAFRVPRLVELVVRDILERMMELEGRMLVRFRVNIKHIEVPEGIEVLAKSSFYDMRGIVDIRLPRTLKRIESRAFRNCIGLEQVTFDGDRIRIDEDAFRNCTSLKLVRTCDGAKYTFHGLKDIYRTDPDSAQRELAGSVPELVRTIHGQVLGNFRVSGTILLQYLGAESRVVVPEGITRIAEEAFAGIETIDRVLLPESLQEIGAEAFRGCLVMQTVTLPKGLRRIGAGAFSDCVKLLRVEIPEQVDVLEDRVFRNCRALQEVQLPKCLRKIGESAFYGCAGLKKIQLPERLAHIKRMAFYRAGIREIRIPAGARIVESLAFAKSAVQSVRIMGGCETGSHYGTDVFCGCGKLKTLVLGEGVCHIPDKFAYGCRSLVRVVLPGSLESVGRHALEGTEYLARWKQCISDGQLMGRPEAAAGQQGCADGEAQRDAVLWDGQHLAGEVYIPENVRIIAGGAFYGNTDIAEVHLPRVKAVGAAAFKGCRALRRVYLPAGIDRMEAEVFSGCVALEEVLLTEGAKEYMAQWRFIGERAFYRCGKLREVCLGQVQEIGREALAGCTALIPGAVHPALRAGERAFADTPLGVRMENGLHVVGNLVVSGIMCAGEVILPGNIQGIAPYAFSGNRAVSRVVFHENIRWIGEGAFFGCSGLEQAVFLDGQRVYEESGLIVDSGAFEKCISLREVVCPVRQVGESAFAGCVGLFRAALPRAEILEKRLFAGCAVLETCRCESAETVSAYCFSGCKRLRQFDLTGIHQIGEYAFEGCESLRSAKFQDEVCLGAHAFSDCCGLEEICLSGQTGEIRLAEYALSGCTSIRRVGYQGKEWRFRGYGDIVSQEFPEMVRLLFHSAFSCFAVERETDLVRYCGAAGTVRIPAGIRRIAAEVFRDAMMLERVEIPESVVYIGARAFHGTPWLDDRRRESPMVVVHDMLLDGSACAGEVVIPPDVRLVCGWAFANGLDITGIRFVRHVQVEEYAFRNCINLRGMTLPDGTAVRFTGLADRDRALPPLARQAVTDSLNCFKTDGGGVLRECTGNISRLRLVHGITEIGEGTFQDGNLLTVVTFSETVTRIGARAFAGCKWLCEIRQAESVTTIGAHAFSGCGMLRRVELSENLRQIGARAFENCTALEEIQIPEGVEEIPERAFYRCHSLKNIKLPSTLKTIGREAFAFCGGVSGMQVPAGIEVGERAFYGV